MSDMRHEANLQKIVDTTLRTAYVTFFPNIVSAKPQMLHIGLKFRKHIWTTNVLSQRCGSNLMTSKFYMSLTTQPATNAAGWCLSNDLLAIERDASILTSNLVRESSSRL